MQTSAGSQPRGTDAREPFSAAVNPDGVTFVICAHNSSSRLPATLAALKALRQRATIAWEVLLIDNRSTDETSAVATREWNGYETAPLRVIQEAQLGLVYARLRGLAEARYALITFVDDDNWLSPDWLDIVTRLMIAQPTVGACGGPSEAVYERTPPSWFPSFASGVAVGPQGDDIGDITWRRGLLWGAGLTVRRAAWLDVQHGGIALQVPGRTGRQLGGCDDVELCLALRLAGWRLWYEPGLAIKHYMPVARLTWPYLRRVHRGSGYGSVGVDGYHVAMRHEGPWTVIDRLRWHWAWQFLGSVQRLMRHPVLCLLALTRPLEPQTAVLPIEELIGRCTGLLRQRGAYSTRVRELVQDTSASYAAASARLGAGQPPSVNAPGLYAGEGR